MKFQPEDEDVEPEVDPSKQFVSNKKSRDAKRQIDRYRDKRKQQKGSRKSYFPEDDQY